MIFLCWLINSWIDIAEDYGQAPKQIDKECCRCFAKQHNWTGNIRELRNVVERLIILSGKTYYCKRCRKFYINFPIRV